MHPELAVAIRNIIESKSPALIGFDLGRFRLTITAPVNAHVVVRANGDANERVAGGIGDGPGDLYALGKFDEQLARIAVLEFFIAQDPRGKTRSTGDDPAMARKNVRDFELAL